MRSPLTRSPLVLAVLVASLVACAPTTPSAHLAPSPVSPSPSPSPSIAVTFSPSPYVCSTPSDDFPSHLNAPCLLSVQPLVSLDAHSPITLSFNQPMNALSVSLNFQPAVKGATTWLDDSTLSFQPYLLAYTKSYILDISGRSARGRSLAGQTSYSLSTLPGPALILQPGPTLRVPILMYHYIRVVTDKRDILGFNLSVTPSDFAAQMDWLAAHGFHPITLDDLAGYLNGHQALPSHPVVLTFDDGYADFYSAALPILIAHDFPAVSYVVPGFWGDASRYMTPAQVLQANQEGIQIGSHTISHVNLATQSPAGLAYQVTASKQDLEQLLGHSVLSFCYPSGDFNNAVVAAVQKAGYRDATTTAWPQTRSLANRYIWGRTRISGGESLTTFASSLRAASY